MKPWATIKQKRKPGESSPRFEINDYIDSSKEHWWLLERAIQASSSGIIIADATREDNPLIYVSKGFERMTGFLSEEVVGQNYRFLQCEDQEQAGLELLHQAQVEGQDCQVILRNYRKNGSLFWNELQLSAVRDQAGELVYFVGIQTDVSDRVKAQQALDHSEQKFKTLVENTPDAIAQFDRNGKYLYISPGMVKTSQGTLTPERIVGKNINEVGLSSERVAAFSQHLKLVLETGKPAGYETIQALPGRGPEYFQIQMVPEFTLDGKEVVSVLTIARNITELKLTNNALQAAQTKVSEILASITDAFFTVDTNWEFTACFASIEPIPASEMVHSWFNHFGFCYSYLNQQAEKLLGHTQQELMGRNLWELFPGVNGQDVLPMSMSNLLCKNGEYVKSSV